MGEGHRINTTDHKSDWMKKNIVEDIFILYYRKLSGYKTFKILFFFCWDLTFRHKLENIIIIQECVCMFHRINVTFLEKQTCEFWFSEPHLVGVSLYIMYFKLKFLHALNLVLSVNTETLLERERVTVCACADICVSPHLCCVLVDNAI
jgi:hypothetical protein